MRMQRVRLSLFWVWYSFLWLIFRICLAYSVWLSPQALPIWVSVGLLQKSQVYTENLLNVVVLGIWLFLELRDEFLSMGPDLGRRASTTDICFNSVPIFTESTESIYESLVFLSCPAAFSSPRVVCSNVTRAAFMVWGGLARVAIIFIRGFTHLFKRLLP